MIEVSSFGSVIERYFAESGLLIFFLIALLFFMHKERGIERKFAISIVVVSLVCVFNPLAFWVICKLGESESYYRFIWMCPCVMMIVYLIIRIWGELKIGLQKAALILVCVCCGGMIGGIDMLANWSMPTNIYQLDDDVIQIADLIDEFSGGKPVVFVDNGTLSENMREYNANICSALTDTHGTNQVLYTDWTFFTNTKVRESVAFNAVDFIAIEKERKNTLSVLDGAGFKRVAASDGYYLYQVDWQGIYFDYEEISPYYDEKIITIDPEYTWVTNLEEEYDILYLVDVFRYYDEERIAKIIEIANEMNVDAVVINDAFNEGDWTQEKVDAALTGLKVPYISNLSTDKILNFDKFSICVGLDTDDGYENMENATSGNAVVMAVPEYSGVQEIENDATLIKVLSKTEEDRSRTVYEDGELVELKINPKEQRLITLLRVRNKVEIKNYEGN